LPAARAASLLAALAEASLDVSAAGLNQVFHQLGTTKPGQCLQRQFAGQKGDPAPAYSLKQRAMRGPEQARSRPRKLNGAAAAPPLSG